VIRKGAEATMSEQQNNTELAAAKEAWRDKVI
jgi:hypothetical protein